MKEWQIIPIYMRSPSAELSQHFFMLLDAAGEVQRVTALPFTRLPKTFHKALHRIIRGEFWFWAKAVIGGSNLVMDQPEVVPAVSYVCDSSIL
jgi:hypothetical protein